MNSFRHFLCSSNRLKIISAAVCMLLLMSIKPADAAYPYNVKITSTKDQGVLTTGCTTRKGREDFCTSSSYSSSIGFPVESSLPQYGPVQIVLDLNRVHPRLLDAMVKREPLTVLVEFISVNLTGFEYAYHRVTLDNAKVIDVRRWTGNTLPSAADNLSLSTVTFDYTSITESNIDGNTTFTGSK